MRRQQLEQQQQAQQAQAQRQQLLQGLAQQYSQTQDPAIMREIIANDPDAASQLQQQFGILDEATRSRAVNQAGALTKMLKDRPEMAVQYWQENLANDPAFKGLADNFEQGDIEGAINEIGFGLTAIGGNEAYNQVFAPIEKTNFAKDLIASGIQPGSEEFKDAVLEKYGKGSTVAYDIKEAVNPETGQAEYLQVSRVNPGEKQFLGVAVPESEKDKNLKKQEIKNLSEQKETIGATLSTVNKIIQSPGLDGFSGLDNFRRFIPGSEAANVAAYVDQLKSQNFLTSIKQMTGMGALSDAEGRKLSAAVAALEPTMSDSAFQAELTRIQQELAKALERIETDSLLDVNADQPQQVVNWSDL
jgi:hypothetical protein